MKLAIVAVLAVGAVGLTVGGLTITDAYHPIYYQPNTSIYASGICGPSFLPNRDGLFLLLDTYNKTPWPVEITVEHNNKTATITMLENTSTRLDPGWECDPPAGQFDIPIISGKLYNMTSTESFEIYNHLQAQPTGFYGNVRTTTWGPVMADVEIIVVNVADHTNIYRTTTNTNGEYFIRTAPGGYLIQAIGGGPDAYKYTTTKSGLELVNLTYN